MYSKILTGSLCGLESDVVAVETDLSPGLPSLTIVGLPDIRVRESKERVRAAILNSSEKYPPKRITINLSPAGSKKEGTYFDLPMALGILAASVKFDKSFLAETAFLGELSLDGRVCRIDGAVPLIIGIRNRGIKKIVLPRANVKESSIIKDVVLYPVESLKQVIYFLEQKIKIAPYAVKSEEKILFEDPLEDFSDVAGQETVKRSLQIGAAGCHGLLMIGPPGAGKTMIAKRIPTILPQMTYEEMLEITKIYSLAGKLTEEFPVINSRPFRAPHHTISSAAFVGGGSKPSPGEISLAHYGVLFLDELPEFPRHVIELLRQPLEEEKITISRANGTTVFPSKIMAVAAMNPCPCGYYGDPTKRCTCSPYQIQKYLSKVSGPFLDRIDMHISIVPVKYEELAGTGDTGENVIKRTSSEEMRMHVERAREIQIERYKGLSINYNSQLTAPLMKKFCTLDRDTKALLEGAYTKLSLSARAYTKVIKLARTIADMEGEDHIRLEHVAEAIQFRTLECLYRNI